MTRLVFDTSAIVKILASPARTIYLANILQTHKLYTSDYIRDEVARVLVGKFGKTKPRAKSITRAYAKVCTIIKPANTHQRVRDCSDQPIINLCIEASAKILVSDDKDLLSATIPNCRVITFAKFWASQE